VCVCVCLHAQVCPTFADYEADGIVRAPHGIRTMFFMYNAQFGCDDYASRFDGPQPRVVQV
jgi:hypothetical protein